MSDSGTNYDDYDDGIPDNSSNRFDDNGSVNSWASLNDEDYSTDAPFAGNDLFCHSALVMINSTSLFMFYSNLHCYP
jgi:hypothetical protein